MLRGISILKERIERMCKVLLKITGCVFSLMLLFCTSLAAQDDNLLVYPAAQAPGKQITPYLQYQLDTAWQQDLARQSRLLAIDSETGLLEYGRSLRAKLIELIGGLPEEKCDLNAQITGRIEMDGYTIEKIIFESFPGYHVTALVYVPDGPVKRHPAVLVPCGHSTIGKTYRSYQQISGRLARRGYVVLCWDPVGQGERSQFWNKDKNDSNYNRVCGEHAILGNLATIAGASLVRFEVWDGMRALDYLVGRPDVDSCRISVTGTSGGGFQSAFTGAIDERIAVSAPSCFISSLPMRMANRIFADPDSDPEQDLAGMLSAGIGHPGLLVMTYPRPLVVSAAVEDFFPIEGARKTFREVETLYRRFGRPERIRLAQGYHPHSFSDHNQEIAFAFIDKFSDMEIRHSLDSVKVLDEKQLWCTKSGQVRLEFPEGKSLPELIRDYYVERKTEKLLDIASLYHGGSYPGIEEWKVLEGSEDYPLRTITCESAGTGRVDDISVEKYILRHSGKLSLPVVVYSPASKKSAGTILYLAMRGKPSTGVPESIRENLQKGYRVVSFDFRAVGENMMRYKVYSIDDERLAQGALEDQYFSQVSGVLANYIYNSLLTGRPYFLQLIEDTEIVARFAEERFAGTGIRVDGDNESRLLVKCVSGALGYSAVDPDAESVDGWSDFVLERRESWPIQYLLPGGAYVY